MLNALIFLHLIIGILLTIVILLQKTSTDGLSGIGGNKSNTGVVSSKVIAHFLVRATIVLTVAFFINAITLGNLLTQKPINFDQKTRYAKEPNPKTSENKTSLPIAK